MNDNCHGCAEIDQEVEKTEIKYPGVGLALIFIFAITFWGGLFLACHN